MISADRQQAFIAAIMADPEDDAPRLVYADWLEENGDPDRAAFIRLQCRRVRLEVDTPEFNRLFRQEEEMLALHEATWRRGLPAFTRDTIFRRGFIVEARVTTGQLLRGLPRLWQREPVTAVTLEDTPVELLRALASPLLARVRTLRIRYPSGYEEEGPIIDRVPPAVSDCPHLSGLDELHFHGVAVSDAAARGLAASPHLRNLRDLNFTGAGTGPDGVAAIVNAPLFDTVETFGFGGHRTDGQRRFRSPRSGDGIAAAVASSTRAARLTRLDLCNNRIGPHGAAALAGALGFGRLASLELDDNPLGDEGAAALAGSPLLAGVTCLALSRCKIGDAGALALARSPHLRSVASLDLSDNPIRNAGALALLESDTLPPQVFLGLYDTRMSAAGARAALASSRIPRGRTAQFPEMRLPPDLAHECEGRFETGAGVIELD